jgi:hypothetical protein
MSHNLYQESINILKKASSASTEAERNRLCDQANEIFRNPDFVKSYHPANSSNNGSGLTSGLSPSNCYSSGPIPLGVLLNPSQAEGIAMLSSRY